MRHARQIRQQFLDFFAGQGHQVVPSSSLIPAGDPTLFFTNAGMVQFKNVFLGEEVRAYTRAATSQKCLRVQGKHNDLEEVGRTPRHHTLFEMLGNFSFGDYFKSQAIAYAWELLTKVYGIPADRLVATVYEQDDEAAKLWTAHLPADRIFRFGEKDNFWAMGENGPCGPCSELHFDWHPEKGKPTKQDVESGRFWEVWNLVFMQYNRADGQLAPLAKPSIDTGMGLERLTAILQGKTSNYETDLFTPIIRQIETITRRSYGHDANHDTSMRVIADHIRATTFLIADGILPSNEGRGYVLRRIMRRAIRHGKMLGMESPFFARVAPAVIDEMGLAYPELVRHQQVITKVIEQEEVRFYETLAHGLSILQDTFTRLREHRASTVPGDVAFKLYDTYGFPKDLTDDIAAEAGFTVDHEGFERHMAEQREQARSASKSGAAAKADPIYQTMYDDGLRTQFVGYTADNAEGTVLALIHHGKRVEQVGQGQDVQIITDRTPLYGEGGGQIGDTGTMLAEGVRVEVRDTQKPFIDLFVHTAIVQHGTLRVGAKVVLAVDADRREEIRKHHTATHILHKALREVLGEHVKQAGSLVAPDRLRFDFSHFAQITAEQLADIEADANRIIQGNIALQISEQAREEAIGKGAMAFFGEKYGATVRVVEIPGYSLELCGGTHVRATGDIGACKIVSESGVAAGVRRIEALCGHAVVSYLQRLEHERHQLAQLLKVGPQEIVGRVEKLVEQVKLLEREKHAAKVQSIGSRDLMSDVRERDGVKWLVTEVRDVDHKALREIGDQYRQRLGSGVVALATIADDKVSLIVMVTKDLTDRYHAGDLIRPAVEILGGKGGGRPDMAQGGGPNVEKLNEALKTLRSS